jgi:hypothetical protein
MHTEHGQGGTASACLNVPRNTARNSKLDKLSIIGTPPPTPQDPHARGPPLYRTRSVGALTNIVPDRV